MGIISNNFFEIMNKILRKEIRPEDVEMVYIDNERGQNNFLKDYSIKEGRKISLERASTNIFKKYGYINFMELAEIYPEEYEKKWNEYNQIADKEQVVVNKEAEEAFNQLLRNGKITTNGKILEKGKAITAYIVPGYEGQYFATNGENTVEIKARDESVDVVCINGQYYAYPYPEAASLTIDYAEANKEQDDEDSEYSKQYKARYIFNNKLELLANQIYHTYKRKQNRFTLEDRKFFLMKIFPEYEHAIEEIITKYGSEYIEDIEENDVLDILQRLVGERCEHTAAEIGKGCENEFESEIAAAKSGFVVAQEPEAEPEQTHED